MNVDEGLKLARIEAEQIAASQVKEDAVQCLI